MGGSILETIIVMNNESFGKGDEELGKKLMGAFLRKIWVQKQLPETIICYNSGVKLVAKGSPVLDVLHGISEKGVEIIACGTCLDHFELSKKIEVGRRTDMEEIVSLMTKAEKVITV